MHSVDQFEIDYHDPVEALGIVQMYTTRFDQNKPASTVVSWSTKVKQCQTTSDSVFSNEKSNGVLSMVHYPLWATGFSFQHNSNII